MMIIGCDLHTRYQQVAMLDTETGELAGGPFKPSFGLSGEVRTLTRYLHGALKALSRTLHADVQSASR